MTALRSPVNWIHVLSRRMQPRAKRIQRSLHYAQRTVLTCHLPKKPCRGPAGRLYRRSEAALLTLQR